MNIIIFIAAFIAFKLPLVDNVYGTEKQDVLVPPIQLATTSDKLNNIENYWVSEKLDGLRAYWDGNHLYSRFGNKIHTPDWFTDRWPDTVMDGELWSNRGEFERIISCVRKTTPDVKCWRHLAFHVFDLPQNTAVFDKRVNAMKSLTSHANTPYLKPVKQFRVANQSSLYALLDLVVEHGGEGLMLHHAQATYQVGRNQLLVKLKKHSDAEATVIGYVAGKGKYTNMLGALIVRTPEGLEFKIGSGFTDVQRAHPPALGETITYKYIGKTARGVPRFASFLRIRQ